MLKMNIDKEMKRGDVDFKYSDNIVCRKWYDNKAVLPQPVILKEWPCVLQLKIV